jgi:hypothetical protein
MKRILLAMMLGIGALGFAQSDKEIAQKYIIDKIRDYNPTDLVPYSKDGKEWALMDVKSRKILTDFVLLGDDTFNPDFYASISVGKNKNSHVVISSDYIISELKVVPGPGGSYRREAPIEKDMLGFQVDENGRMTAYNKDYEYISSPIMYKGEYYAIISSKEKEGRMLINQKGEEQEGFHFRVMKDTYYKDKESGETILYVEDFEGKKGFITISGKKKLYGELMNEPRSYVFDQGHQSAFGYSLQNDNVDIRKIKKSGIVDISTQEWLIKPQEKYKIYSILYTSSEIMMEDEEYDVTNRNKVTVYFLATDQSGQHFVLDINGNPILPKK